MRHCDDGSICKRECGVYFCKNMQDAVVNNINTEAEKQLADQPISNLADDKSFGMSQYMKAEDLYKAKAEYYQDLFQRALKELALVEPVIRAKVIGECVEVVKELFSNNHPMYRDEGLLTDHAIIKAIEEIKPELVDNKCEHGKHNTDYCEPCGRIHGG